MPLFTTFLLLSWGAGSPNLLPARRRTSRDSTGATSRSEEFSFLGMLTFLLGGSFGVPMFLIRLEMRKWIKTG